MADSSPTPVISQVMQTETTRTVDAFGVLGEPVPTGRTLLVRTLTHPGGQTEVLSIDVQSTPGDVWVRLPDPTVVKFETEGA
ncbi:hypothetical protein MKK58_17710 [Methylobacterium sp. J-078]|uniref:hypothetical protein n=1 Tax=Methylobacterium sp. J-078 TaxID=2836657 RepID=UPI001FB9331A|nr:hypothetical protein [Methylobacterium sp. J-078]MCJ2046355.1 hypothetical protein [Methylobacterium sp. J-078]